MTVREKSRNLIKCIGILKAFHKTNIMQVLKRPFIMYMYSNELVPNIICRADSITATIGLKLNI